MFVKYTGRAPSLQSSADCQIFIFSVPAGSPWQPPQRRLLALMLERAAAYCSADSLTQRSSTMVELDATVLPKRFNLEALALIVRRMLAQQREC
jgi:hypothetical protein